MKYLDDNIGVMGADSADDSDTATGVLKYRIAELETQIVELPAGHTAGDKAKIQNELARTLLALQRNEEAWDVAREAFDVFVTDEDWESAVLACESMYESDQSESLPALGQGIWLAVTFPIDPELSVAMLQHVVDETPDESDGAALSAAVAHYIADLRSEGKQKEELQFFTGKLLAAVARRHSEVDTQEQFSLWMEKLELNDPDKFLPRLRNVVDVLVQESWWIDRDALWAKLPVN
ncbi:MAG: hypothetical protein GXP09_08595 [Gammaproteobacteria bacterium]|nr:hypothetical protein [Gammaproteobacteria bacterium]